MTDITPSEQFNHLAEEVQAIIAQRRFNYGMELLEMRHEIGRAILDSPLYAKNKKGQGKLIAELAEQLNLGERTLRYAVEFAEKWPKFDKFMEEYNDGHKLPGWKNVLKELPSGKEAHEHQFMVSDEYKVEVCNGCKQRRIVSSDE